jgi:hypothetical protein
MSTVLLLEPGGSVVAHQVRLRHRLAARWHARRVDLALAEGATPDADVVTALRAQALIAPPERSMLAGSIRRLVREACTRRAVVVRAPIARRKVLDAADELESLARRLLDGGPVAARGVAQVGFLLGDARSPLYGGREELGPVISRVLSQLEPASSSAWL